MNTGPSTRDSPSHRTRPGRFVSVFKHVLVLTVPSIIAALLLLELSFRFVIPATRLPVGCFDHENSIYKACPDQDQGTATFGKFAEQRGRWRINNEGWNSPVDYHAKGEKPRIAVIGDSFIEAMTVDTDTAYPSLLAEKLGGEYEVYRFGVAGAPLSQYLNIGRYANRRFDPDIVIYNVVHNDFYESVLEFKPDYGYVLTVSVVGDSVIENAPKPDYSFVEYNWKTRWLRKSAVVRYVIFNLRLKLTLMQLFSRKDKPPAAAGFETGRFGTDVETITKATDYIVRRVHEENNDRRVLFVMDAPRGDVYNGSLDRSESMILHRLLGDTCARYTIDFLDLTEPIKRDYEKNHIKFNSPYDGHWNDYAHRFVSNEVYAHLVARGYVAPTGPEMIGRATAVER